jgi:cell division protein FtsI (penicillin-binding protein 3)
LPIDRSSLIPQKADAGPGRSRERMTRLRVMLLALSVTLWGLVVTVRLVHLQVFERAAYEKQRARQSERTINLDPRRGAILDRQGRPLAVSVDAESIYAVPQDVTSPARTAAALARALGLDAAARKELAAQLQKNRAFIWVRRKVDPQTARAVRDLQLDGIGFLTENRRYYPKRELASQVLGYVGVDNTGMSGVEYAYENVIRGRAAKVVVHTDARRRPVGYTEKPSTDGMNVVLTLDESIQYVAERELDRAMIETQSASGVVVVVEPWTGEILAMANRPTFNPNRFASYPSGRWKNRAVADAYEPGSMFKIVTAAAGIQEKVVDPDEILDCGQGVIEIAGTRINDHAVFDKLSFRDAVVKSSDIGMIRVAQRVGRENFNRYMHEFGFGAATGVDLPGESAGLLRPPSKWSAISLASLSFGQEVGVTALQMAMATAAVANGGYLMKPLVVRRVEDGQGRVVKATKPLAVRKVLETGTVFTLTEILKDVVRSGTGKHAALPGYVVAGKTGTAQKVDASGRYSMVDHVASFAGFVPAVHPALVILVSLDSPRGARNQGGDVAAPVFARVAEEALRHLAVPPDDPDRVLRVMTYRPDTIVPAAYRPSPPVSLRVGGPEPDDPGRMPDLHGQSAREAAIAAARRGLVVVLKGSGRVAAQSPEPGTEIEAGVTCALTLSRDGTAPGAAPRPDPTIAQREARPSRLPDTSTHTAEAHP